MKKPKKDNIEDFHARTTNHDNYAYLFITFY